jgi:RNA polymerase sigma-70 factor, ECF subfamily
MRTWYAGVDTCLPFLATHVMGSPGHWQMFPTRANGQPAAVAYCRGTGGLFLPYGVVVLTAGDAGITAITAFGDPGLVTAFGFPASVPAHSRAVDRVGVRSGT